VSKALPSEEDALRLLKQVGCSKEVIEHCIVVSELATKIAEALKEKGFRVDIQLVKIGGLLHDIGRSKTHSVDHSVIGADIARKMKLPEEVVNIIERHVGGGISKEEAEALGWPEGVYMPKSMEEKIVSYADKLVNGSRTTTIENEIKMLSRKLGADHPAIKRVKKLDEEFKRLLGASLIRKLTNREL